jgi:hypothetical protein
VRGVSVVCGNFIQKRVERCLNDSPRVTLSHSPKSPPSHGTCQHVTGAFWKRQSVRGKYGGSVGGKTLQVFSQKVDVWGCCALCVVYTASYTASYTALLQLDHKRFNLKRSESNGRILFIAERRETTPPRIRTISTVSTVSTVSAVSGS